MQAELLRPSDARWHQFLAGTPHDFYHLPAYVALCARQEGGQPAAFWAREGDATLLAPLLLRQLPAGLGAGPGLLDATAPYGYPAPLLQGPGGAERMVPFLEAFQEVGAAAGIVSAFFRGHPLLPLPGAPLERFGTVREHGETVYVDLSLPETELARQTRVNHRSDVRRLLAEGYRVQVDAWERLEDFQRIYQETMEFHTASEFYFFNAGYFQALRECLGEQLHLCVVEAPQGEAAAVGLFTCVDGLVQFHLSGTTQAYRRVGPTKLMLIHMRDWAKARGERFLHLGGGVGCQADSLAFFKAGFSKLRSTFRTFRMILQPGIYAQLVQRRRSATPEPGADGDFFPAYRRP